MKKLVTGVVVNINEIASNVFRLDIEVGDIINQVIPGQFCSVYVDDKKHLLPRPISVCDVDLVNKRLSVVFMKVGDGTHILSNSKIGDELKILMPLGNGYSIEDKYKNIAVVGGGVGVPPMVMLYKKLKEEIKDSEITTYLGFRDETFLVDEFENANIATDSGKNGTRGNVLDLIKKDNKKLDVIYACGPKKMLEALVEYAKSNNIKCYVSMEERMGCSIGACVGCVVKINDEYKKVCVDGPVFDGEEVVFYE